MASSLPISQTALAAATVPGDHPGQARILEYSLDDLMREDEVEGEPETLDESAVAMTAYLCRVLAQEVDNAVKQMTDLSTSAIKVHDFIRCPLCPFRAVVADKHWKRDMPRHLVAYHAKGDVDDPRSYIAAGLKVLNVVKALFDHDQLLGNEPARLQARASALIRAWVVPPLQRGITVIDKELALVLTGTGPQYQAKAHVQRHALYRRVGNTYYDRSFFEVFFDLALVNHGRMKTVRNALISRFVATGCSVTHMLPLKSDFWMMLLEDVIRSPFVQTAQANLVRECVVHQEFKYISMDGTVRCAMRLKGQESYRCPADVRNEAAIDDADAVRRVLTVRGRTGAVLSMQPIASERAEMIHAHLKGILTQDVVDQVEVVATDMPSGKLHTEMVQFFPHMRCVTLDPVHIVITYNNTHWKKATPGQDLLRRLQAKFNRVDYAKDVAYWGGDLRRADLRRGRPGGGVLVGVHRSRRLLHGARLGLRPAAPGRHPVVLEGGVPGGHGRAGHALP